MTAPAAMHVLIVDDNPSDVMLIKMTLKEAGLCFETTVADDGDAAIAFLRGPGCRPDLIILDLNLPKRHGTEVLQMIRAGGWSANALVVVLSSSPQDVIAEVVQAANVEADCYLTKPPSLDEFLALGGRIRECFEARYGKSGTAVG